MKRAAEATLAAGLLLALAPVLAVVALAVLVTMGSPVLFRQRRAGLGGRPFEIYKFRTMRHGQGSDDERLTRTGRFLRSSSLDELPGLVNIVRGEMSFVGPRPLPVEYLELYSGRQGERHRVKPGITGLAQINGRNQLDWEERFELDLQYVESASLRLDLAIAARTVKKVVQRDGISAEGVSTMRKFTGTRTGALG